MCLFSEKNCVKEILDYCPDEFVCYKVLVVIGIGGNYFLKSPFYGMTYGIGVNKSDATQRSPHLSNTWKIVYEGIHVFLTKESASNYKSFGEVIVKVIARKKDLLGADRNHAVFKKVELTKEEYRRVIKNIKRRKKQCV